MDPESSLPSWPEDLPDDEFSNFLEFGMPFADLNPSQQRQQSLPPRSLPAPPSTGATSTANPTSSVSSFDFHSGSGQQDASQGPPTSGMQVPAFPTTGAITPGFYVPEDQQPAQPTHFKNHPQHDLAQSHYAIPHGQTVIPPTPNSIELHGGSARYPRVDENDMYHEQAYYTPLISPAMTPLETQFRLPEYTIPGEYFTPLTSPALEAQNSNNAYQIPEMGFMQSPGDTPSSPGIARKHRRGPSTTTNRFSARAKKQQSPSVRPQARKKSLLGVNSDEVFNGLNSQEDGSRSQHGSQNAFRLGSNESSQDSVSPEPLSEPLMPPPAIPQVRRSPSIAPQSAAQNAPATPAMLMRIQRSQQQQENQDSTGHFTGQAKLVPDTDDVMTDISLPEAAAPVTGPPIAATQSAGPRPKMARIDTAIHAGVPTPATSTNATPALEPKSAPVVSRNQPPSIAPSPRSLAMPSPSGPVAKKADTPNMGPSNRKRPSLSSAQPSPQLRPKISPNIQPLAPRGDDTSALYLASKSNYQHILDGTLLPGVSYPETLAENLSSKRTNHKLAEQGRRNRINHALKEIETLIPEEFAQIRTAKEAAACNVKPSDKEKEKAGNQAISKASTVEMAIDYIKALQMELKTTQTKLADVEGRLETKSDSKDVESEQ